MAMDDINIMIDNDSEHSSSGESAITKPRVTVCSAAVRPFKEVAGDPNNWSIHKVPRRLRTVNEKAYEPNVISIGPYHHHREHLAAMEVIKRSCFAKIVEETELDMKAFIKAMKPLEKGAVKCYQGIPHFWDNNFVEMMVYDGCFIVQLIRKKYPEGDFFKMAHIQTEIRYDLLLLENQIPFFVLFKLYSMIVPNGGDFDGFARSALSLFNKEGDGPEIWPWFKSENCPSTKNDIKHLLDLVHSCCRPSQKHQDFTAQAATESKEKAEAKARSKQPKLECSWKFMRPAAKARRPNSKRSWKFIRNATELEEAGISFSCEQDHHQGSASLFDIEFTKVTKELKIPTLLVDDNTERILRNFMAYEQFIKKGEPTCVCDYVVFMDNLINTSKDVQLLCNCGIIDNCLGDDEAVAKMFNKLRDFIYWSEDFYYAEIFGRVNQHCQRKWNKYKATLKREYFNSPWSLISFLAAVILLLLTLLQTIFSILSYF